MECWRRGGRNSRSPPPTWTRLARANCTWLTRAIGARLVSATGARLAGVTDVGSPHLEAASHRSKLFSTSRKRSHSECVVGWDQEMIHAEKKPCV